MPIDVKEHVIRDLPPRVHDLTILAERSGLRFDEQTLDWLADVDRFNLAGRYPDALTPVPSDTAAQAVLARAKEVLTWLNSQFSP